MLDWNRKIIEEFRANKGSVATFARQPLLLLTHTGAKTGKRRTNPLAYFRDGDRYVVVASKGGAPTNPDWYYNLIAHPRARVEVGDRVYDVIARVAEEEERDRIWEEQKRIAPGFADYEQKTSRQIPVVVLELVQAA
jgi:deazaflavin-dependent oxidoreductase (nitroreductase family)